MANLKLKQIGEDLNTLLTKNDNERLYAGNCGTRLLAEGELE